MNLSHILTVFKKELTDMFRDRKTIISSILIPLLIFPIMYGFMGFSQKKVINDVEKKGITIAIQGEYHNTSIEKYLREKKELRVIEIDNPEEAIKKGTVSVVVFVGSDFDEAIRLSKPAPITIQYDDSSQSSLMAAGRIREVIGRYSSEVVAKRLKDKGIDTAILVPVNIVEKKTTPEEEGGGIGAMIFSMLLPLLLTIYSATGVLPSATDNGAGEKERGTLEPLLTTQANRLSLLMGKYLAITVAGVIGTTASMAGLLLAQSFNPDMLGRGRVFPVSALAVIALASICLSLIFAALELAISVYARSFKEAQTYLSPVTILAMVPAFTVYMLDPKNIPLVYFNIPIVNIICIIKEIIAGIFNPLHLALAFGWAALYIVAAISFARYMFNKESVIFRV